jgi:hypothetical protein
VEARAEAGQGTIGHGREGRHAKGTTAVVSARARQGAKRDGSSDRRCARARARHAGPPARAPKNKAMTTPMTAVKKSIDSDAGCIDIR